ncbi:hypothetical protein NKI04_26455 [Mesorhizobium sp. M0814]|uniref:hypothetical protein n=1 Tax=Mesorhizobium sp. M0814 TaxID=2957004 RepID=UPI00333D17BE
MLDDAGSDLAIPTLLQDGQVYILDVAIRGVRIGLTKDNGDQPTVQVSVESSATTVWVALTDESWGRDGAHLQSVIVPARFDSFVLPATGDSVGSASIQFLPQFSTFYERGGSEIRLGIRLYHKLDLVDHLSLVVSRVEGRDQISVQWDAREPAAKGGIGVLNPDAKPRRVNLSVSRDASAADRYRLAVVLAGDTDGRPHVCANRSLPKSLLDSFAAEFRQLLVDVAFGAALSSLQLPRDERDRFLKKVSLLGTRMAVALFDGLAAQGDIFAVGEMLRGGITEASAIQIALSGDAKDLVLPWQILTIADDTDPDGPVNARNLWGFRYLLEVRRCDDGHRVARRYGAQGATLAYARWHFQNEAEHFARIQEIARASTSPVSLLEPIINNRNELLDSFQRGADLYYVYAHGHAAAPRTPDGLVFRDAVRSQILAAKQRLATGVGSELQQKAAGVLDMYLAATSDSAESFLTLRDSEVSLSSMIVARSTDGKPIRFRNGPIVFLNTCQSAQVWNALESSFVGFFLGRGASAVVGTEATIPVLVSEFMGRTILQDLMLGKTLGESVLRARSDLLELNNPLGLCYTVYGLADARLLEPLSEEGA